MDSVVTNRDYASASIISEVAFDLAWASAFNTIVPVMLIYTGAPVNPIYALALFLTMCVGHVIYGIG
jgi:hypothetical protein